MWGVGMHEWVAFGEFFHGETSLGKEVVHFVAHLETLGADAWANDGMKVGRAGAIGGVEYVEIAFHDSLLGAFPSSMNGRDGMMGVIP